MTHRLFTIMQVADLSRSKDFFTAIGLEFDPRFTNDGFATMLVGDAQVLLHVPASFGIVTKKHVIDTENDTEAVFGIFVDSRAEVERLVDRAVGAGGREYSDPWDADFFYQRVFEDLDGHQWEICWVKGAMAG
jgi:predicted lactoylglutathione lyase